MTPTPPALDLAALTVIANAASPGNWMWVNDREDEHIRAGKYPYTHVTQTDDVSDVNALHIAAFDPPTVLALIARAEAAEAKIAAVRELHRPVPVYTTEAGDCEHEGACEAVELSDGAFCPAHTDGLTCNACAQTGEHMDGLPTYPCPTIAALDGDHD